MPELKQPVILFRQKSGMGIRTGEPVTIDGQSVKERGVLGAGSQVVGESFSLNSKKSAVDDWRLAAWKRGVP